MGMGSEQDTAKNPAAAYAARSVRALSASQGVLRARPTDPPGRNRPTAPASPIHAGILDHMLATRDEIVEQARAVIPPEQIRRPAPRRHDAFYEWLGEHTPYLDEKARLVTEAMMYRQGLQLRMKTRDAAAIRWERCPSCRCFSLWWRRPFNAAVCFNTNDLDDSGRPRRYTLQQIAENAVEILRMRAAT